MEEGGANRRAEKDIKTDSGNIFKMFIRQGIYNPLDFSIGLKYKDKSTGEFIILLRCNGPTHPHRNSLEREILPQTFHIHQATERYMADGQKPDKWAYVTKSYDNIDSAIAHFVNIAHITPAPYISKIPQQPGLFNDHDN